jgi:hypothetical protein
LQPHEPAELDRRLTAEKSRILQSQAIVPLNVTRFRSDPKSEALPGKRLGDEKKSRRQSEGDRDSA